jgi:hypothetical protein
MSIVLSLTVIGAVRALPAEKPGLLQLRLARRSAEFRCEIERLGRSDAPDGMQGNKSP